nr:thiocyanate methyltransferase 1-like [Quercus suber]
MPEHYVVGLDILDVAIKKAMELSSSLLNASCFNFLKEDFFTWSPTELPTELFFCAIEPDLRLAWAQQICDILKPGGELITLMFPGFHEIVDLPEWLGNLSSLQELYIVGCKYLVHLPTNEALRCLTKLKMLMIYECPELSIEQSKI